MAEPSDKVFDVAHPDQTKPSATSRPVIVGHRPMVQDPMMSTSKAAESKPSTEAETSRLDTNLHTAITVTPLSEANHDESHVEAPATADTSSAQTDEAESADQHVDVATSTPRSELSDEMAKEDKSATLKTAQHLIESRQYNVVVGHFHHRSSKLGLIFGLILVALAISVAVLMLTGLK